MFREACAGQKIAHVRLMLKVYEVFYTSQLDLVTKVLPLQDVTALQWLIQCRFDVNDGVMTTIPLLAAAILQDVGTIHSLLENGVISQGQQMYAYNSYQEFMKLLKQYGILDPLTLAIGLNKPRAAKILIECGADVNIKLAPSRFQDGYYWSPLSLAVVCGLPYIVRILVMAGADVFQNREECFVYEFSVIGLCIQSENTEMLRALLQSYKFTSDRSCSKVTLERALNPLNNRTPLEYAVRQQKPLAVRTLVHFGADFRAMGGGDPLTFVIKSAPADVDKFVRILIGAGADISREAIRSALLRKSKDVLQTLLSSAQSYDDTRTTSEVLLLRALSNTSILAFKGSLDTGFCTPLLEAIELSLPDVAAMLVSVGADFTLRHPHNGHSALVTAVKREDIDVLRAMLSAAQSHDAANGAGQPRVSNCKDEFGQSLLYRCFIDNQPEICEVLLLYGATHAYTDLLVLLDYHIELSRSETTTKSAGLLLDLGIDADTRENPEMWNMGRVESVTPVHELCWTRLNSRGITPQPKRREGMTPLHRLALRLRASLGELALAELLLDRGADVNAYTVVKSWSYTPLHLAALYNELSMVSLLVRRGMFH